MKAKCLLGLVGLAVMLPALADAQHTTYDYDKTAVFNQYQTYAFKDGNSTGDPLMDARIVAALEYQLAMKGFTKTDVSPDVYVQFSMDYDKELDISTYGISPLYGGYGWGWGGYGYGYGMGYGPGWGWGPAATDVRVREILIGTLAIDLVDAKRERLVWRGLGTKEVDTDDDPEDRDKTVRKAVAKIMRRYPPSWDDD